MIRFLDSLTVSECRQQNTTHQYQNQSKRSCPANELGPDCRSFHNTAIGILKKRFRVQEHFGRFFLAAIHRQGCIMSLLGYVEWRPVRLGRCGLKEQAGCYTNPPGTTQRVRINGIFMLLHEPPRMPRSAGSSSHLISDVTRTSPGAVRRVRINNAPAALCEPRQSGARVRVTNAPAGLHEPTRAWCRGCG